MDAHEFEISEKPHVLILAAGQGKRMHSDLPKVLHPLLHRPMLHYLLDTVKTIEVASITVVVGHGANEVKASSLDYPEIRFITQAERRGTADAVKSALPLFKKVRGNLLVLNGDVVLLKSETLKKMLRLHAEANARLTLLTTHLAKPKGYGRIIRSAEGRILSIREELDCSETERKIQEINCGVYCFDIEKLFLALSEIKTDNAAGEYYLTDTVSAFEQKNDKIVSLETPDIQETIGINDRYTLVRVEAMLRESINRGWMERGTTLLDSKTTRIDPLSKLEQDTLIEGQVLILRSYISKGATIESGCRIIDSIIGPGSHLKQGSYVERSEIGPNCSVGPYAHLRPGTRLDSEVKIGNFVEIKNSLIGEKTKASHLSYIGDAEVGKKVNVGCGFITCNFDGKKKHRTTIEDQVFIGSDTQVIAPIRLGERSYIGSGSTLSKDVPARALAFTRAPLKVRPNWKQSKEKEKP